jgi:hypothetical protein
MTSADGCNHPDRFWAVASSAEETAELLDAASHRRTMSGVTT